MKIGQSAVDRRISDDVVSPYGEMNTNDNGERLIAVSIRNKKLVL